MKDSPDSRFESPLRYPGGKACIFDFMSRLFFENDLIGHAYAEPYAGGAGLALKLLYNEYVEKIYINDLDFSIFNFWKCILQHNTFFCDWLEDVAVDIDTWQYYKNVLRNQEKYTYLDLAKATFFLNRTNVSGVIKGGAIGGLSQQGKYKLDARFNKTDLLLRIEKIARFKHRIKVSNYDGVSFIQKLNRIDKNIFIYLDPPYVMKGADLYMSFYAEKDHRRLARKVDKINKKWMVSYDNNEFIIQLYEKHRKLKYRLSQSASNRVGDEILVFSERLQFNESIQRLREPVLI